MNPAIARYISAPMIDRLVAEARHEDGRDLTGDLLIPDDAHARGAICARAEGVVCGLAMLPAIARHYSPELRLELHADDGDSVRRSEAVATVHGPLRAMLAMERVALNFLGHLSGIASFTARFVTAVDHTRATIADTRKTLPGLRAIQKYAVACGGGVNHRMGLSDALLVKDNHLRRVSLETLGVRLAEIRNEHPRLAFIEVEVDTLAQLDAVLSMNVDWVLLDNMSATMLREAVRRRDASGRAVRLEASGGVSLENAAAIAETGVDRIAIGALTHSAAALDLGLDLE